jgi:RNA polymerase-binding protein DksA
MTNTPLSTSFIKEMERVLLAEKERFTKERSSVAHKDPAEAGAFKARFPNYGDDEEENAMEVADYAANLSIEQSLTKLLRDIDAALARIKDGTYGICKYCHNPIEEKRLSIRPTSSSCVECKKAITQEA